MSFYTVISPYDLFYAGENEKTQTVKNGNTFINLKCTNEGREIERLISTNPQDYLKKELLPGRFYKRY